LLLFPFLFNQIPDTISAISLARSGYTDGAIAGAIGSQVINISLGVGIPALFVCLTGRGYLRIVQHEAER
jgi:Ca2+/Na+ antiporter